MRASRAAAWVASSGALRCSALPTSPRCGAVLQLCRSIGTSTSVWRTKQEALARPSFVPPPRPDFRTIPAAEDTPDGPDGKLESALSAEEIVGRARIAAEAGRKVECLTLIWALKDLPRDTAQRKAIDSSCPQSHRTLLQSVVRAEFADSTELLLELGPSVGLKDEDGNTALHIAAQNGFEELARLLLCLGRAPVNARDVSGRTPLHLSAEIGHVRVSRVLMQFGANAEAVDGKGVMPIEFDKTRGIRNRSAYHKKNVRKVKEFARDMGPSPKANDHYKKGRLPHLVAPKLVLTPTGYCPVMEDGTVRQMARGVRFAKSRQMPTDSKSHINWYAPRG